MMPDTYLAKYLRISEDDEDLAEGKSESASIANQRRLLDTYIMNHEELSEYPVREFVDDGVSGVTFHRPAVQELLNEVRRGRVFCIIVKDLSRFGRNYIEVGDYIEQIFPFLGVRFISISDHFDSVQNSAGIEIGFKNLMHDLYSRDLSGKVKSAISVRQKHGSYNGGGVPFGYMLGENKDAPFVPDKVAAKIVGRIFQLAADGNTTLEIADLLNKEAVLTPGAYKKRYKGISYCFKNGRQNLWTASQVNLIIRNEVYKGTYVAHKLSTVKPGVVKRNSEFEYIRLESHHERLVEEELFEKAQGVLKTQGKSSKKKEYASALKGKVKCGCCGYSMTIRYDAKAPYYRCWTGQGCGSYTKINVQLLEATVWDILQKFVEIYLEQEKKRKNEKMRVLSEIAKIQEAKQLLAIKMEHCKVRRLELYHQWKEGVIARDQYVREKEALSNREVEYRKNMEQLEQDIASNVAAQEVLEKEGGQTISAETNGLSQELVGELIERIEVYDSNKVVIKWKVQDMMG